MSMFIVDSGQISENGIVIDDAEDIRHLAKVLRASAGDRLEVSDNSCWEYSAEIEKIERRAVILHILGKRPFTREPRLRLSLYQCLPKPPKMDYIVQKSAELGLCRLIPVFSERSVARESGDIGNRLRRWRKLAREAAKQCGRGILPEISGAMSFDEAVSDLTKSGGPVIFPYEEEKELSIKSFLREYAAGESPPGSAALIIGPEGGFSGAEAESLRSAGVTPVSLGRTVLRCETAALAALSMTMYEFEL